MYTGPNIERDGLVFGYDTGYGVADNSTATRFYPGEPVDNEFYNSGEDGNILSYSTSYGGYGTLQSSELDAFGTNDNEVYRNTGKMRFGPTGGQDIGTLISGNTYTFSIYLKHVAGQTQSTDMEFDICDRANSRNYSGTLGSNMTYDWKRFSVTALHNNNSNYHFIDVGTYQGTNVFDWCCPQIEVSSHASPFTNTERSSTQSLIDLTKTTDIDVSNVSFDSTGQPTFDGTDDSIVLADPGVSSSTGFSIELVIKPGNASTSPMVITPLSGGIDHYVRLNSSGTLRLKMIPAADSTSQSFSTSSTLSSSNYHHVIFTFKQSEGGKAFYNGSLESSASANFTALDWTGTWRVGQRGNNTFFYQGELPVLKIYNRALSAAEVQQNFKAYKNRFNM